VKPPRFLFVVGVGSGMSAHPVWPDAYQPFEGEVAPDGSWVAWRLTGANHRELGRSARVFPNLGAARADAQRLSDDIASAETQILTVPHTATWGWRLTLDGAAVATSSRGYLRHRECTYNLTTFISAAATASLSDSEPPRVWQLLESRREAEAGGADTDVASVQPG